MRQLFVLAGLVVALLAVEARAGLIVSIDMDPGTVGIQNERAVTPLQNFSVDVVFQLTDVATTLRAYDFNVRFDTAELNFVSRTETRPAGFSTTVTPALKTNTENTLMVEPQLNNAPYGELARFDGIHTTAGVMGPNEYKVATLTFQAVLPLNLLGDIDILARNFVGENQFLNSDDDPIAGITFNGGRAVLLQNAAVPEPGSFALVAIVVAGAGAARLRKRRGKCEE